MPKRHHIFVLLYFVLLALVMTWPLVTVFSTHFIGDRFSDANEYAHHIWWMQHAMRTGGPVFTLPFAYPDGLGGAWLWGNPLQSFPAWLLMLLGVPLPAAFNAQFVIALALNGWTCYLLMWSLTRRTPPAILAGSIFALYPAIQGHLIASHIGLITLWGAPLYVQALLRLRGTVAGAPSARPYEEGERGRKTALKSPRPLWEGGFRGEGRVRAILLAAAAFVLTLLGNSLLLVYVLFPITLLFLLTRLFERDWGGLLRTLAAVSIGGAVALAFVGPVALEQLNSPIPPDGGDVTYSADLLAIAAPSFYNPAFSELTYARNILGEIKNVEGTAYVGLIAAVFALFGLLSERRARWWGLLALFAWVLSLGPLLKVNDELVRVAFSEYETYVMLPWGLINNLPVLNIARTPARFNLVIGLAVAMMAGYGLAWAWGRGVRWPAVRWGGMAVLVAVIGWEYAVSWEGRWPAVPTEPLIAPAELAPLRDDDSIRAVFNIPHDHLVAAKDGMMMQATHGKPLIAGHVTRRTPVSPAMRAVLQGTLDAALLDSVGADVVILHRVWDDPDGELEAFARARLGAPFYDAPEHLAWHVPEPSAPLHFAAIPADDGRVTTQRDSHVYAPEPGWTALTGTLSGEGETLTVRLNGTPTATLTVNGAVDVSVPLYLEPGYHTVTLALDGDCPRSPSPALRCRAVAVEGLAFADFAPDDTNPVSFDGGITLRDAYLTRDGVRLAWDFAEGLPENVVRFVHLLDADGAQVAGFDQPPGPLPANTSRTERVPFNDLPPGTYTAYLGWYMLPEVVRVPVVTEGVPGAESGWVRLGEITVR